MLCRGQVVEVAQRWPVERASEALGRALLKLVGIIARLDHLKDAKGRTEQTVAKRREGRICLPKAPPALAMRKRARGNCAGTWQGKLSFLFQSRSMPSRRPLLQAAQQAPLLADGAPGAHVPGAQLYDGAAGSYVAGDGCRRYDRPGALR